MPLRSISASVHQEKSRKQLVFLFPSSKLHQCITKSALVGIQHFLSNETDRIWVSPLLRSTEWTPPLGTPMRIRRLLVARNWDVMSLSNGVDLDKVVGDEWSRTLDLCVNLIDSHCNLKFGEPNPVLYVLIRSWALIHWTLKNIQDYVHNLWRHASTTDFFIKLEPSLCRSYKF